MEIAVVEPGVIPKCPVAPDALRGIRRQQTNPEQWNGVHWAAFAAEVRAAGVELDEQPGMKGTFATDAGGTLELTRPHGQGRAGRLL